MELKTILNALLITLILSASMAGCLESEEEDENVIRIAFKIQDDYDNPSANPQILADFIVAQSGYAVEIYPINSDIAAIEAIRFGHADIAFLDGGAAWIAWQQHGLDAILADQKSDGTTSYTAQAWVLADSDIQSLEDLEGKDSCHTGWLKSAGMLMPMGYMINNGIVDVSGDVDDISSLRTTIEAHFGNASIPVSGDLYYSYSGAFRCMTEGVGDVAFGKMTSYEDHCEGNDWCLERDQYRPLEPAFGQVPSHPVMVNTETTSPEKIDMIVEAFLALNTAEGGAEILDGVLNTPGISEVTTEGHLGSYSEAIGAIPGIAAYFDEKYDE
jgi:melanoma-associated antigen p97